MALSVETEYTFPHAEKIKAFLGDPLELKAVPAAAEMPAKAEAKEALAELD